MYLYINYVFLRDVVKKFTPSSSCLKLKGQMMYIFYILH